MKAGLIALALVASFACADGAYAWRSAAWNSEASFGAGTTIQSAGSVSVYTSPNGGAERAVVTEIGKAKTSILVQAYSFSSPPIFEALADAKQRGADVRVLVDKEARAGDFRGAGVRYDLAHGVLVMVDEIPGRGIAHSKTMVIDGHTVITGSFNFSRQAETTNVENLLVFHDSRELAEAYTRAWLTRAKGAVQY